MTQPLTIADVMRVFSKLIDHWQLTALQGLRQQPAPAGRQRASNQLHPPG